MTIELIPIERGKSNRRERSEYSDETFLCTSSDIEELVTHIKTVRADVLFRHHGSQTVTIFIPRGDPPPIRLNRTSSRRAYFTIGELERWRFLRHFPHYPLKDHQKDGIEWLLNKESGILADDMGLGKTIQAIAAFEKMQRTQKVENLLVVCPKSLIGVWEAEIRLWAPRLCTISLHTSISREDWRTLSNQCHVAITNYEALRSNPPNPGSFDVLIFDEVHRLKNPSSLNYASCYKISPKITWGLSGTPLENKPADLTAILHLLDRKRISPSDDRLPLPSIRSVASNYILRRDKQAIKSELPQVREKLEIVPLTSEQRNLYQEIIKNDRAYSTVGGWIATFNKLRDVCDYEPHTGKSSKIDRTIVILDSILRRGEKAVVFSWRIVPLDLLAKKIETDLGQPTAITITGQTSSISRSRIVSSFQSSDQPKVLLCSMRATAEGLTLTAANHVIFLNEWWNPAVNSQARDRVNRIGQAKDVFVHKLRTSGTVESQLNDILSKKSAIFDEIVNRLTTAKQSKDPTSKQLNLFLKGTIDE
ncbi:MAG: DEAD/DEAH box helicase [Gammaproteobacteria bacterium]|nr:DEAD/DEAH box helicase [Gammaproteobacteria bacterium]